MLRIVRAFLTAGMMINEVVIDRDEGTPQGGPLSPLLANVLLDEVDRTLEARGHRFVRYADDCNVYVRSQRAGERVMALMQKELTRPRLQINAPRARWTGRGTASSSGSRSARVEAPPADALPRGRWRS